jgi:uncharacterized protein DUF5996
LGTIISRGTVSMNVLSTTAVSDLPECWPALPLNQWQDTCTTLHMWTQVVGKIRMELTPRVNHWWNVPLYVTPRGLTTSSISYGARQFEMEFDLLDHHLAIRTSDPETRTIALAPRTVADFYAELMSVLKQLRLEVAIWKMPVEVPDPIAFDQDKVHRSYDREYVERFRQVLASVDKAFKIFRGRFLGKSSPVHFFWGSFDLAVTRFSGRPAPPRTDPDPVLRKIMQEAYSHEVISAGWWPGGGDVVKEPAFYCYAAPEPQGFAQQTVDPASAWYEPKLGEYLLKYEDVRRSASPSGAVLDFLQSTYEAGANCGKWDRESLEEKPASNAGAA